MIKGLNSQEFYHTVDLEVFPTIKFREAPILILRLITEKKTEILLGRTANARIAKYINLMLLRITIKCWVFSQPIIRNKIRRR